LHELPIVKSIFKTVTAKADGVQASAVNLVVLEIGILRDFIPELVQKYWDYITPGSIAEGSKVEIREKDAVAECGRCGNNYPISRDNITDFHCPICGYEYGRLISGNELRIVGIEIVRNKEDKV